MCDYVTQVKETCDALVDSGSPISEVEQIASILNRLTLEYNHFVDVITTSRDPINIDGVISVLVDVETHIDDPF
ncbi:hypothetical protein GQ457_03G025310 [Hibiscus cannabinus]